MAALCSAHARVCLSIRTCLVGLYKGPGVRVRVSTKLSRLDSCLCLVLSWGTWGGMVEAEIGDIWVIVSPR